MAELKHQEVIDRQGKVFSLSCACGLWRRSAEGMRMWLQLRDKFKADFLAHRDACDDGHENG